MNKKKRKTIKAAKGRVIAYDVSRLKTWKAVLEFLYGEVLRLERHNDVRQLFSRDDVAHIIYTPLKKRKKSKALGQSPSRKRKRKRKHGLTNKSKRLSKARPKKT